MIRILLNGQPVQIFLFLPHISLILRTVLFCPFKIGGVVIQVILILMQYPRPAHQGVITGYKFGFRHKSINTRKARAGGLTMTPEEMQDRDIVEFTDDSGNTLMLEVMDYFYYNGQEFAALCDAQENPSDDEPDDDPVYIMQVNTFEDENGEEMEEFVPPEEALMEKLIQIVRTRFTDEEDGDDEE